MHPISRKQRKAGRSLWGNVQKEHIFTSMEHAKKEGFSDVVYETTAIYGTTEGWRIFQVVILSMVDVHLENNS